MAEQMPLAERDRRIREAISPLFWWAREPAVISVAIGDLIVASLYYFEQAGRFAVEGPAAVFLLSVISTVGVIIRSQVTPVARLPKP